MALHLKIERESLCIHGGVVRLIPTPISNFDLHESNDIKLMEVNPKLRGKAKKEINRNTCSGY